MSKSGSTDSEIILTLDYITPVLPEQLIVYQMGSSVNISRVEILNSQSGLGAALDLNKSIVSSISSGDETCDTRIRIPASATFEVDRVFLTFEDIGSVAKIAAVELYGRLEAYTEPSVYWRVPLPDTLRDIAMGFNGQVYVVTQKNELFSYDVEGNLLGQINTPSDIDIFAMAIDSSGNLLITDAIGKRFMMLTPEGDVTQMGGNGFYTEIAINPQNKALYLLSENGMEIYDPVTAEQTNQFPVNASHTYTNPVFNTQGKFFMLRDFNWNAAITNMDVLTGEELDAYPLLRSSMVETVAEDLAIDGSGNLYVLFSMNTGNIAIHQLKPDGRLNQRFGRLTSDATHWPEGTFLDPRVLAVSFDGRFILVADGYEEHAYLTCYLMEIEE